MKILVVQDHLRSGGTERQSVLLANAFAAAGHATTLLTFRPRGPLAPTVSAAVTLHTLQPFDTHLDWFAPGLMSSINRACPDVALCMGRMANCYADTIQLTQAVTEPIPNLGVGPIRVVSTMRTGKRLPWRYRRGMKFADHVVANSHEAARHLTAAYAIPADKITVIHNALVFPPDSSVGGVPPPRDDSLRTQHAATPATTVLLCVAMFRPEKKQCELIEIAAGLPEQLDWQLWLAGDGPTRRTCEQLVAAKALAHRVKFLGFQRDPTPLYTAADLAVHASSSEALSNFLIEAQSHGLPAVAYEAQGIAECMIPGDTGWGIARDDRTAFRAALLRLMNEAPVDRHSRSTRARNFARTAFAPWRTTEH